MLEIFQSFEQVTGQFSPSLLIISGILMLLLGLCIWIAGHSLRKILIFLAGLAAGVTVGLYVVGRNTFSALFVGGLAALIALIFEKVLVVLLAAAMASAIAFTILAEPYFVKAEAVQTQNEATAQEITLDFNGALQELKKFGLNVGGKIKQVSKIIPVHIWVIIAAATVITLVCGIVLWRFTSVLFFSVAGTVIIFLGMILLLSYKGTEPINNILNNSLISAIVFLAMIAFGTVVQLLLCKGSKEEDVSEVKPGGKKGKNESKKMIEHNWRTS